MTSFSFAMKRAREPDASSDEPALKAARVEHDDTLPLPFTIRELFLVEIRNRLDVYGRYAMALTCRTLRAMLISPVPTGRTGSVREVALMAWRTGYARPFVELYPRMTHLRMYSESTVFKCLDRLLAAAIDDDALTRQVLDIYERAEFNLGDDDDAGHMYPRLSTKLLARNDWAVVWPRLRLQMADAGARRPLRSHKLIHVLIAREKAAECPVAQFDALLDDALKYDNRVTSMVMFVEFATYGLISENIGDGRFANCRHIIDVFGLLWDKCLSTASREDHLKLARALFRGLSWPDERVSSFSRAWAHITESHHNLDLLAVLGGDEQMAPNTKHALWKHGVDWLGAKSPLRFLYEGLAADADLPVDSVAGCSYSGLRGLLRVTQPRVLERIVVERRVWGRFSARRPVCEFWLELAASTTCLTAATWRVVLSRWDGHLAAASQLPWICPHTFVAFLNAVPLDWPALAQCKLPAFSDDICPRRRDIPRRPWYTDELDRANARAANYPGCDYMRMCIALDGGRWADVISNAIGMRLLESHDEVTT